jgi:hypothetical protein
MRWNGHGAKTPVCRARRLIWARQRGIYVAVSRNMDAPRRLHPVQKLICARHPNPRGRSDCAGAMPPSADSLKDCGLGIQFQGRGCRYLRYFRYFGRGCRNGGKVRLARRHAVQRRRYVKPHRGA